MTDKNGSGRKQLPGPFFIVEESSSYSIKPLPGEAHDALKEDVTVVTARQR